MTQKLSDFVDGELLLAQNPTDSQPAFRHLERAHILSQYSTRDHVRVHWAMLKWGLEMRDLREVLGQIIRIAAAATKTAVGFIPVGNTCGSNVSPIRAMPLPDALAAIIEKCRS